MKANSSMTSTDKVNILMVDDQPGKLLSYEAILADLGENLIKATSGKEALEHLLKTDVAVVLMDVSMPELDGFELADMIRQHPRFQKTAIIFISAVHLTDMDRLQGYARGAVDYISVPVIPDLLRAKVSVFAELHRKARELRTLNQELEKRVLERTEELRERAELLDLASEAIFVRDFSSSIRFWNKGAEALYGWTPQEALGKNVHQLLKAKFPESGRSPEQVLLKNGYWQGEIIHTSKSGNEIIVASRQGLQTDSAGLPKGFLEINRDITEQKRTEAALRSSEKAAAMGRLAGTIAHEINNPIEAVKNTFFLLKDHESLDAEARELARMAEEELERISHITRQTLSFYRESQRPTEVALSQVLEDVLGMHSRKVQMNGIRVEKHFEGDGPILGFPVEMRQAFLNLVGNAIEAMQKGGTLTLRLYPSVDFRNGFRPGVRVSVFDTGSGINPENKNRIFEPFFSTKDIKGTGLGLWVTRGIVQKHEGVIKFRSFSSQAGGLTCFSVFIPSQSHGRRVAKSNGHSAA
jgi:two-component system, NtrC family, sensor kinase